MARGGRRSGTPGGGHSVEAGAERRAVGAAERGVRRDPATAGGGCLCALPGLVGLPRGRPRPWGRREGACWSWLCHRALSSPRGQGYWRMLGTWALWVGSAEDPLDCEGTTNWTKKLAGAPEPTLHPRRVTALVGGGGEGKGHRWLPVSPPRRGIKVGGTGRLQGLRAGARGLTSRESMEEGWAQGRGEGVEAGQPLVRGAPWEEGQQGLIPFSCWLQSEGRQGQPWAWCPRVTGDPAEWVGRKGQG